MPQEITNVFLSRDVAVIDVGYTADGDVGGVVPHGITGGFLAGAGAIPSVIPATPNTPATAAQRRLADIIISARDATNVTLDKVNVGGSGTATGNRHIRLVCVRNERQFSATRTALLSAVAGGMLGGAMGG